MLLKAIVFVTLLIGIIFVTLLLIVILELRRIIGIYSYSCLPLCTSCVWIFLLLPLCVGAPAVVIYIGNSDDDIQYLAGVLVAFVFIQLMIGVSIGAIILNYVFQQMEIEKKAKFVLVHLQRKLSRKAVRSSEDLLRLLYDQRILHGEEVLKEALSKGSVAQLWRIPSKDPDLQHNQDLISAEQYEKFMKLRHGIQNKKEMEEKKQEMEAEAENKYCCKCCYASDDEFEEISNMAL